LILDTVSAALQTRQVLPVPPVAEEFHREHMRVLTNTLANKVEELDVEIAERGKAELALRQQSDTHNKLLNALSDVGTGVGMASEDARFIYVNDALGLIYGYGTDELLALPSAWGLLPETEITAFQERYRQRVQGHVVPEHYEIAGVRKDGQPISLEFAAKLLPSDTGSQVILIVRDIADRKRADAQIRYLATVLENVSDGIVSTDLTGNIQSWNAGAEAMLG
jgi:PAS domain S-box-containing protein